MKRLRHSLLILMTLVFMIFGVQAVMAAETGTTDDGFAWMYEDGTMAITGYSGDATVITIPATINGIPVTMIHGPDSNRGGFSDKLTSVTIPNTVTTIGKCAFYGCTSLTGVTIPDSVKTIGYLAFFNCKSLANVTIPNSVNTIEGSGFFCCRGLTSITIPNSVKQIEYSAFMNCVNLTSVSIPDSVTRIEDKAFYGCKSLTNITIPNSVEAIDHSAFFDCTSLTDVTIPSSVTYIGLETFGYYGYFEGESYQTATVPGFTINGHYGTCAERYARDNGFAFTGKESNIGNVARITSVDSEYDYTGEEIRPTIRLYGCVTFTEGVDFTVSYKKNKKLGTATIIVKGINNYTGTIKKNFKIKTCFLSSLKPSKLKTKVKKGKVKVSWKKLKQTKKNKKLQKKITYIEVQYSDDKYFKNGDSSYYNSKKTSVTLNLKRKKTYYIHIRYLAKNGISQWSSVKIIRTK